MDYVLLIRKPVKHRRKVNYNWLYKQRAHNEEIVSALVNETNTVTISSSCAHCLYTQVAICLPLVFYEVDNEISMKVLSINAVHRVYGLRLTLVLIHMFSMFTCIMVLIANKYQNNIEYEYQKSLYIRRETSSDRGRRSNRLKK